MCIFFSLLLFLEASQKDTEPYRAQSGKLCRTRNHTRLVPAGFSWVKRDAPVRGLQPKASETKICTKRIRNLSSIRKLVKTIIHHLKCKYSRNKNNRNLPVSFFCFFSCVRKTHYSNAVKIMLGQGSHDLIYVLRHILDSYIAVECILKNW